MNTLNAGGKVAMVIGVIVIIAVIAIIINHGSSLQKTASPSGQNIAGGGTTNPGELPAPANSPNIAPAAETPPHGSIHTVTPKPIPTISLTSPTSSITWKIFEKNIISWDKTPGITGSISLLTYPSGVFVGTILNQVGPNQTSYTWNTRDLYLSRTNPLKKDVLPGTYLIMIAFDGNHLKPIITPAVTITN